MQVFLLRGLCALCGKFPVSREGYAALVVDLDGTVCISSGLDVARKAPEDIEASPGAAAAVTELARHYQIVYLSARDDALINRSRRWLDLKHFPHGPLLVRDLHLGNLSAGGGSAQVSVSYRLGWLPSTYPNANFAQESIGPLSSIRCSSHAANSPSWRIGNPTETSG